MNMHQSTGRQTIITLAVAGLLTLSSAASFATDDNRWANLAGNVNQTSGWVEGTSLAALAHIQNLPNPFLATLDAVKLRLDNAFRLLETTYGPSSELDGAVPSPTLAMEITQQIADTLDERCVYWKINAADPNPTRPNMATLLTRVAAIENGLLLEGPSRPDLDRETTDSVNLALMEVNSDVAILQTENFRPWLVNIDWVPSVKGLNAMVTTFYNRAVTICE